MTADGRGEATGLADEDGGPTKGPPHTPENWRPFGFLAAGIGLFAVAVVPTVLYGTSNPYAAVGLVLLGLVALGAACGTVVFDVARNFVPTPAAVVAGIAGSVPALLPMLQPGGADIGPLVLYVLVLGVIGWIPRRRSVAAAAFLVLSVLGALLLLIVAR